MMARLRRILVSALLGSLVGLGVIVALLTGRRPAGRGVAIAPGADATTRAGTVLGTILGMTLGTVLGTAPSARPGGAPGTRRARRAYGEGERYTVIYDANQDQIRDPDLVYPGQIFVLPREDAARTGGDGRTR